LNLFRISDFDIRISSEQEFSFKHYIIRKMGYEQTFLLHFL